MIRLLSQKKCDSKGKICTVTEIEWVESIKTYGYRFNSNEVLGTWYEDYLELYNIPKTWNELIPDKHTGQYFKCEIRYLHDGSYKNYHYVDDCGYGTPLEKSALALLKSQMIIDKGYGGIVTDISYHTAGITSDLEVLIEEEFDEDFHVLYPFIFKNTQLAHEFLSRPENVQLIKDFYQKS